MFFPSHFLRRLFALRSNKNEEHTKPAVPRNQYYIRRIYTLDRRRLEPNFNREAVGSRESVSKLVDPVYSSRISWDYGTRGAENIVGKHDGRKASIQLSPVQEEYLIRI